MCVYVWMYVRFLSSSHLRSHLDRTSSTCGMCKMLCSVPSLSSSIRRRPSWDAVPDACFQVNPQRFHGCQRVQRRRTWGSSKYGGFLRWYPTMDGLWFYNGKVRLSWIIGGYRKPLYKCLQNASPWKNTLKPETNLHWKTCRSCVSMHPSVGSFITYVIINIPMN